MMMPFASQAGSIGGAGVIRDLRPIVIILLNHCKIVRIAAGRKDDGFCRMQGHLGAISLNRFNTNNLTGFIGDKVLRSSLQHHLASISSDLAAKHSNILLAVHHARIMTATPHRTNRLRNNGLPLNAQISKPVDNVHGIAGHGADQIIVTSNHFAIQIGTGAVNQCLNGMQLDRIEVLGGITRDILRDLSLQGMEINHIFRRDLAFIGRGKLFKGRNFASLCIKLGRPFGIGSIQGTAAQNGIAAQHRGLFNKDDARTVLGGTDRSRHTCSAANNDDVSTVLNVSLRLCMNLRERGTHAACFLDRRVDGALNGIGGYGRTGHGIDLRGLTRYDSSGDTLKRDGRDRKGFVMIDDLDALNGAFTENNLYRHSRVTAHGRLGISAGSPSRLGSFGLREGSFSCGNYSVTGNSRTCNTVDLSALGC